ncbi:MAG: hypothetical protein FWC72_06775 [Oscillospiraceae bacterium]|nr:hypothetical protein [Oscillospiraceae bacterium]
MQGKGRDAEGGVPYRCIPTLVEVIQFNPSPIRVNTDNSAAALGIAYVFTTDSFDYDAPYVIIHMIQHIPDSEHMVSLGMILGIDFFTEEDFAIVEELSTHLGVDLMAYIAPLLVE